jgi:hypothetical protein
MPATVAAAAIGPRARRTKKKNGFTSHRSGGVIEFAKTKGPDRPLCFGNRPHPQRGRRLCGVILYSPETCSVVLGLASFDVGASIPTAEKILGILLAMLEAAES